MTRTDGAVEAAGTARAAAVLLEALDGGVLNLQREASTTFGITAIDDTSVWPTRPRKLVVIRLMQSLSFTVT